MAISKIEEAAFTLQANSPQVKAALNATGDAPIYACRAWVNFNVMTNAIRASGNVSSITDYGTGDAGINFSTALPDANYAAIGSTNDAGYSYFSGITVNARTTSQVRIQQNDYNSRQERCDYVGVAVFR